MKNSNSISRMKSNFLFCSLKLFVLGFHCLVASAQECPKNIDFETGTFQEWTCYVGFLLEQGNANVMRLSPTTQPAFNRHTMNSASPGNGLDPYGNFPVNCPNGSGHSIRLGNNQGGALAEGLSYEFTIPPDRNLFTIVYSYAIVLQNPPHLEYQQPRFAVEVTNVTRNQVIGCSSFEFHTFGPLIPGFKISTNGISDVPIWYKDWTTVSINLNGQAGETVRLFFKTGDCTIFDHFGYAYIDVNSECNGEFTAAKYCAGDTMINFTAPDGYRNYLWSNNDFSQVLGTSQTVSVTPQVAAGSSIPVILFPEFGYGCIDTLYGKAEPVLAVDANAGPDLFVCYSDPAYIGSVSTPGFVYTWTPPEGLSDPAVSNPLANPVSPTTYILKTSSSGGGCVDQDTVFVNASFISDSLQVVGKLDYCLGNGDSLVLSVQHADSIQWFRNGVEINGAIQTVYRPIQTGQYYAALFNKDGCSATTPKKMVRVDEQLQGIEYPVIFAVTGVPTNLDARNIGDLVLWKPSVNLNDPAVFSPVFTGNADQSFTVEIKTNTGCTTVDTQLVKISSHADIYVPTAFTPNQDGLNDILRPVLVGIKELHYFRIFNRWGQLLFESKTTGLGWDGRIKGQSTSSQVIVWMVEGVSWDNKIYFRKGTSTVLR